jgi:hypothetical protein
MLEFGSSKESSITISTSGPRLLEMIMCNLNVQFTDMSQDECPSAQY